MEPFASSVAGAALRPASAAGVELSTLLRDGRVLSAEVLSSSPNQAVVLAIGRHTVPAQSDLRLDPGARFQVRVEQGAEGTVLRILGAGGDDEAALLAALRGVVGRARPLGEVLAGLAEALRTALSRGPHAATLSATADAVGQQLVEPGGGGALQARLAALGLDHELALASALGARHGQVAFERLRSDLKALLLRAEVALETGRGELGPVREALARALAGLEAEQLFNLARERSGEPIALSLPFPDGEAWTTARLLVPPRDERDEEDGDGSGDPQAPFRLSLGLELTRLGPLRADLALQPGHLTVRLLVTDAEVARRLEEGLVSLRERLSDGRHVVDLSVRLGTLEEASRGFHPLDIRYLRENHVMDVDG